MATPNQKAEARPISFMFHNTATNDAPVKVDLVIRPEDLTRPETSRAMVHQSLGGAWLDSWGEGVPSVQISGTTGWGQGDRKDGQAEFLNLHEQIFKRWHLERESAVKNGFSPDKVKLIFADELDDFIWVVAPMNFTLRRNKSRPLLSQYQINLSWLSDGVADLDAAKQAIADLAASTSLKKPLGFLDRVKASLAGALHTIKTFATMVKGKIGDFLGPIKQAFADFTSLTASVLEFVQGTISAGMGVVTELTGGLFNMATNLCRGASNVTNMFSSIMSIPDRIKSEFSRVSAAFTNAFCVLRNAFKGRRQLPNLDDLYGASTCSSTAGGRPISKYANENPFPVFMPVQQRAASISTSAASSVTSLVKLDTVLAPMTASEIGEHLSVINSGVILA
jgi:hypothetical protein